MSMSSKHFPFTRAVDNFILSVVTTSQIIIVYNSSSTNTLIVNLANYNLI
jgi:hypothetical protein